MEFTTSDGLTLAYDDIAPPDYERAILLVHGFVSNRNEGWKRTGWYTALERRRFRVIALDQRGHGQSGTPHDPAAYGRDKQARDVVELMDHLGVNRVDLFGYSMGARVAAQAALTWPERFSNLILGGVGDKLLNEAGRPRSDAVAEAMEAEDPATISEPFLRSFRQFADEQGEDRAALAAFSRASSPPLDVAAFGTLPMPVLVVAGSRESNGDPEALAQAFPLGKGVVVPGCDHFSAIPHALTKAAVFDFIDGVLDDPWAR